MPEQDASKKSGEQVQNESKPLEPIRTNEVKEDKPKWTDKTVAFFTLFLFLAAVIQGFIFYKQWQEMHSGGIDSKALAEATSKAASAAAKNAEAAESFAESSKRINDGITAAVAELNRQAKEVELARQSSVSNSQIALESTVSNFQKDQRAWVGFTTIDGTPQVEKEFSPTAHFINSGRTPALDVRVIMFGLPGRMRQEPKFPMLPNGEKGSRNQFMPNVPYENSVHILWNQQISESGFSERLAANEVTVYVMGRFDYKDTFGIPHWTTFCQFLNSQRGWNACENYNESDNNER